jgi:DNA-binding CsgD family transcriptional regulator
MVSLGLSNEQIGRRLGVSVHAVKFHLGSIYRKLEVANRTQAAAMFLRAAAAAGFEAGGRTG